MKYRELLNNITEVAKKHPNINSTFIGDVYELNHRNDVDYCAFVITQGTHRVNSDEDYIDYTLNLFYVDRLTADESNRTQIHSSGIDFMNSLLKAVEKLGVVVVEHTENVFNERFNDVCAGVYATVVLRVDIDECGQTIEIITPDELKVIEVTENGTYNGLFKQVDVNVQGGGKEPVLETLNVKDNGTYRPNKGVDGFDIVEVNINKEHHNVTSKSITANGTYNSEGDDVWNSVDVNVPERVPVLESLSITDNGTYTPERGVDGYNSVEVNVPKEHHNVTSKSITANGVYNSDGDEVWNEVSVNVPQKTFNKTSLTKEYTANGQYSIATPDGYDGISDVNLTVNVPSREPVLNSLSVTDNGTYTPESGVDGYNSVSVNVPKEHHNVTSKSITANGTYNSEGDDVWNEVSVNVPEKTFNKASLTKEYTSNGQYSIATPDGYDGISDVNITVNVATSGGVGKFGAGLSGMTIKTNAKTIDLSNLDTSTFNSMNEMFLGCKTLDTLDLSSFDTSNVTGMTQMFKDCSSLTSLDLSSFDTSNLVNTASMFWSCRKLTSLDLSGWNTSNVTGMSQMFYICSSITSLDLSGWNTSNLDDIHNTFGSCSSLTSLDLSGWNTSKVTRASSVFNGCSSLTSLNISNWNMSKVTMINAMFNNCSSLETINCNGLQLPNINLSNIGLNSCSKLTVESIVGLLNALPQSTHNYSFQIGQVNIDKLSEEQKAIATNKNWRLV